LELDVCGGEDGEGVCGGALAPHPSEVGSTVLLLLVVATALGAGVVSVDDREGAPGGPPALVPTWAMPQLVAALAGPMGGIYGGGEGRGVALAPDPVGLAADVVLLSAEVVAAAAWPSSVPAEAHAAHKLCQISHGLGW
jgi:hypothetical protein